MQLRLYTAVEAGTCRSRDARCVCLQLHGTTSACQMSRVPVTYENRSWLRHYVLCSGFRVQVGCGLWVGFEFE